MSSNQNNVEKINLRESDIFLCLILMLLSAMIDLAPALFVNTCSLDGHWPEYPGPPE